MKKAISILLFFTLLLSVPVISLSSCSKGEEVSVFYYTYSDAYISSVRSAMDSYFKKNGVNYHNYDAGGNQTTQTEQVDTAIAKGASLLIVNVVDTGSDDAARAIISKAKSANIPVIFFNRSVNESVIKEYDKCVFVGTDYEMAGILQGELIGNFLKDNYEACDVNGDGRISYVMFKGQQGNAEAEARTRYAVEKCNEILADAGYPPISFYDKSNSSGYLVDQNGLWSNEAANNYMKTILSAYSESGGNMVELVIANNDEMALGALGALEEAGYNKSTKRYIPVFGIDATEAAVAKIESGAMSGTVKQDGSKMAEIIGRIAKNCETNQGMLMGIEDDMKVGQWRVNIPYSVYVKEG